MRRVIIHRFAPDSMVYFLLLFASNPLSAERLWHL
jgi:hypothetical protein